MRIGGENDMGSARVVNGQDLKSCGVSHRRGSIPLSPIGDQK